MRNTIPLAALCGLIVAGPAGAVERRGGTEAEYAQIQAFHDRSIATYNAGDIDSSMADYLERLRVLGIKSARITGREGMRRDALKSAASGRSRLVAEIEEMEVNGSGLGAWAYMICRYAFVSIPNDASRPPSAISDGRYTALLSKTADGWKVLLDIDNGGAGAAPDLVEKLRKEIAR